MSGRPVWRYEPVLGSWVLAVWAEDGAPVEVFASVPALSLQAIAPRARQTVAGSMQRQHGIMPPAAVFDGPTGGELSVTCPVCWAVSFSPVAARSRRCPHCPAEPAVVEAGAAGGAG